MTTTAWQELESCPDCAAPLVLLDGGSNLARLECASCSYADTWTVTEPAGDAR